jgi:RND superfamily putative drug exporter
MGRPEGRSEFMRWGMFIYRFRRVVAGLAVLLLLAAIPLASGVSAKLSSGGWLDPSSESAAVNDRLADQFGEGRSLLIAVFRDDTDPDAASTAFQTRVTETLAPIASDSRVKGFIGFAQTADRRFISTDGHAALVVVELTVTDEGSVEAYQQLRPVVQPPSGMHVAFTGYGPISVDAAKASETDIQRAETISLPIDVLVLITVFASVLAAGLPLLVAGLAIPTSLALMSLVADHVEMSIYVLNVATMLGLALAIDYSLFMVSRFREELSHGRTVEQAVARTVATSGKAVVFSGVAVAIGLSGLLLFRAPALASFGIGGSLVVICSVGFALTFLPAILGMLGHRVNALSLGRAFARLGGLRPSHGSEPVEAQRRGAWERVARAVMARPFAVLVPVLAILLVAGTPLFRMQQGVPAANALPPGLEARDAWVAAQGEFPDVGLSPIILLVDVPAGPTSRESSLAIDAYAANVAAVPGIERIDSPFTGLRDPASGALLTAEQVAGLYALPEAQRPPGLSQLLARDVRDRTVRLDAVSAIDPVLPAATSMIGQIRDIGPGDGLTVQVGGTAAVGRDFLDSNWQRMPLVVGLTLVVSALALFLLFGSVVLPIKAVLMTLLSISASFGALVWIFQEGNLSNVLGFHPLGYTLAGNPILMFCVLFGLSMDYEVLLLSRIQEAYRRTGDNTASVAEGLSRTAGVITGAALVMVTVFSAFGLADIITIKSLGVAMAIAVALDATVVRVLLVPATMRLLGRWNWWAPGPLGRLADRLGFSHVESEEEPVAAGA